jgi:hypothetical protein
MDAPLESVAPLISDTLDCEPTERPKLVLAPVVSEDPHELLLEPPDEEKDPLVLAIPSVCALPSV